METIVVSVLVSARIWCSQCDLNMLMLRTVQGIAQWSEDLLRVLTMSWINTYVCDINSLS